MWGKRVDLAEFVGIPFVDGGRGRDGADCWGLLRLVYAERFGIALPALAGAYGAEPEAATLEALVTDNADDWAPVAAGAELPGDGLLMTMLGRCHVGVVAGGGMVLHTQRGSGAMLDDYRGWRLASRVRGFFRHREALAPVAPPSDPEPVEGPDISPSRGEIRQSRTVFAE